MKENKSPIELEYNEQTKIKNYLEEESRESIRRRLLSLPQQSSSPITADNQTRQNQPEPKKENPNNRLKNNNDNKPNIEQNEKQSDKRNLSDSKKISSLTKASKKNAIKRLKKESRKKALKYVFHLGKKALIKAVTLAGKALLSLLGVVGLPALLVIGGLIIIIIVAMTVSSMIMGSGEGLEDLGESAVEIYEYIKEESLNSVDMDKPEQAIYRVPEELLASIVQLDSLEKKYDSEKDSIKKSKKLIDLFAEKLKPDFHYENFTVTVETRTRECNEETNTCSAWSLTRSSKTVPKITRVEAWNGIGVIEYEMKTTEWSGSSTFQSRETYYIEKSHEFTYDFSKLDRILTSQGYKEHDKKMFEVFYEMATGVQMFYTNWLNGESISYDNGYINFDGTIIPGSSIPPQYMPYYLAAAKKFGVPWEYIAAIHFKETTFSTHPSMISNVGAIGHTQFMPCSWIGWSYSGCKGTKGNAGIPKSDLTNLSLIRKHNGYGQDGNNDGLADPWQIEDALHATAYYLKKNGINSNPKKAIRTYNNDSEYVKEVMAAAEKFRTEATYVSNDGDVPVISEGDFMRPATGKVTSNHGPRWGKFHHGIDIGKGGRTHNVPVVAIADGKVSKSYYSDTYGHVIFIVHNIRGKTYESVYAHLTGRAVSVGQTVKKGQFLGNMGNTGRSFGAHLHFELHKGRWNISKSNSVDPLLYLPK